MEITRLCRGHRNVLSQAFIMALMLCETHSAFLNAIFEKVPLQGQLLELYDTGSASHACTLVCSQRRLTHPACQAFEFKPGTKTCIFYKESTIPFGASSLYVFLYRNTDRFHAVAIGDQQFFIYVSSETASFWTARTRCHQVGGFLLEFDSLAEYEGIRAVTTGHRKYHYFVGATDETSEGSWVTDRDNKPVDTSLWIWTDHEPDDFQGNEDCARVNINFEIADVGDFVCHDLNYYLCEKDV